MQSQCASRYISEACPVIPVARKFPLSQTRASRAPCMTKQLYMCGPGAYTVSIKEMRAALKEHDIEWWLYV